MPKKKTVSMRKKPKQDRSTYMVDLIFESTLKQILKKGSDKITTTEISKVAGISVGSFYQYFPNKEALYLQISKKITKNTRKHFEKLVEEIDRNSIEEEVTEIVDYMVNVFIKNGTYLKAFIKLIAYLNNYDFIIHSRAEVALIINNYLVRKNLFKEKQSKSISFIIANRFVGVLHTHCLSKEPELTVKELKEELTHLFISRVLYKPVSLD